MMRLLGTIPGMLKCILAIILNCDDLPMENLTTPNFSQFVVVVVVAF